MDAKRAKRIYLPPAQQRRSGERLGRIKILDKRTGLKTRHCDPKVEETGLKTGHYNVNRAPKGEREAICLAGRSDGRDRIA